MENKEWEIILYDFHSILGLFVRSTVAFCSGGTKPSGVKISLPGLSKSFGCHVPEDTMVEI